jgi:hypothetical protein
VSGRNFAALAAIAVSWLAAATAGASQLSIGSSSAFSLGNGTLDLGCASLLVAGSFAASSGTVNQALDVTISLGGTLNGDSGILNVTGNWDNSAGGAFAAGTSSVNLIDGCGRTSATISGETTFWELSMTTTTEKAIEFAAGSTQTINALLTISGTTDNLLTLRSTSPGSEATLNIQGAADANFVSITDIHAVPNPLSLGPNSIVGSNTTDVNLCGDISGNMIVDPADVMLAREHLMGKTIAGDITFCNVIGPFDPLGGGADCTVADIFVLARVVASSSVTSENTCNP